MPNSTPILVNGRSVGFVRDGVFYKSVRASLHFLRKPRAIAFDCASLEAAVQASASKVLVTDQESGCQYSTSISQIRRAGFEFDRGFGRQVGLPLSSWTITRCGEMPARQLSLWRGEVP